MHHNIFIKIIWKIVLKKKQIHKNSQTLQDTKHSEKEIRFTEETIHY